MVSNNSVHLEKLKYCWENAPYPSLKITSYFPAYVELFGHLVGTKCVFIETGILDGGSLFMWRDWLGPDARIIGIDLNPEALKWREKGFEIFIGDQGDPDFWKATLSEIGSFDALLDDGGHQSFQQIVTAIESIKFARNECVVVVEDTASSLMSDFSSHGAFSFLEYAKSATDILLGRSFAMYPDRLPRKMNMSSIDEFRNVYGIVFYNGIVGFKVNSDFAKVPELVRNRPYAGASDFRYEGKTRAKVNWPVLRSNGRTVTVRGGETFVTKLKAFIRNCLKITRRF